MKLEFTAEAIEKIADLAVERKTGARGLRSIMESVMMDLMYEIPSDSTVGICTITKEVVEGTGKPEIVYRDTAVPRKSMGRGSRRTGRGRSPRPERFADRELRSKIENRDQRDFSCEMGAGLPFCV